MEEDDLKSMFESIISAVAYAFELIRRWDRAVLGVGEVMNWFGVKCGSETILVYVNTPQDCHSDLLLCAFADEGAKESSIWYSRALQAELWLFVCVCVRVCGA